MAPRERAVGSARQQKTPSFQAIAFAAAIVRSKPSAISVKDYIRQLRQNVATGRRTDAPSSTHQHLDQSAYWRSEAQRLNGALQVAEEIATRVKCENESLRIQLDELKNSSASAKKRKRNHRDAAPDGTSAQKAKRKASLPSLLPSDWSLQGLEVGAAGNMKFGETILCSIFQMQASLTSDDRDPMQLTHCLSRAATSVSETIQQTISIRASTSPYDDARLKEALTACARTLPLVIRGYTALLRTDGSPQAHGQASYVVVQMFSSLLESLQMLSAQESRSVSSLNAEARFKKEAKSKEPVAARKNEALSLLAKVLEIALQQLDPENDAHRALFEGFMFCIISKLGGRLYPTAFGHERGASIDEEIRAADCSASKDHDSGTMQQIRLEAPYLIHLLSRAMSASSAFLGSASRTSTSKTKQTRALTKASIAMALKNRLQRTMVNAMFGAEGIEKGSDLSGDCLKLPDIYAQSLPMPRISEEDVAVWFKQETWRVLGWELLTRTNIC